MQIVTANRLIDGRVVFRDLAGRWVEDFTAAVVVDAAAAAAVVAASAADVAARLIVEPYAVDVIRADGGLTPKAVRERIRITGPTSGSERALPRRAVTQAA
ncbi:MAG: DUF2849 domain-containing protein [Siculibacillus sp.]